MLQARTFNFIIRLSTPCHYASDLYVLVRGGCLGSLTKTIGKLQYINNSILHLS